MILEALATAGASLGAAAGLARAAKDEGLKWKGGLIVALLLASAVLARRSFWFAWAGQIGFLLAAVVFGLASLLFLARLLLAPSPRAHRTTRVALALLGFSAAEVAGGAHGLDGLYGDIEQAFAPMVAALAQYHAVNGRYPETSAELVPRFLQRLPECPEPGMFSGHLEPYHRTDTGGPSPRPVDAFHLTCGTFFLQRYTYDSELGRWYAWD